ncbi:MULTISPECIES: glutamate--cysteine ligase [Streptomyces]|uniref:glutamate--cysteine ligase n=1 Tax=Streptomyces TaxID=1883 RepID=UPI00163C7D84|nr:MULTISPECIES: glutamate--cysteine ligase [Streptomyces]MBC2878266.1 glutamate--cysteine ligase [Streptomyces sp. TYQ1024]UBI40615.1 glutamate--cysteine ligase [Streptomyces mobaraensis]UKW33197.1 glutamate--cysteine ligase [Streptomyces sp. TYQ1024]
MRSVGVEEELLLVDPGSGEPRAVAGTVLALEDLARGDDPELEKELQREQLETATRPTADMTDLAAEVRRRRATAIERAGAVGAAVAALATSPLPVAPSLSAGRRYRQVAEEFGLTAQEQLTCGCHVHVSVASDEEGVAVLDRIRPWLAPLLALSANSPFWQGHDSGYSSYRSQVWGRWPSAGPVEVFGGPERYHTHVRQLLDTRTLLDKGMIYFDARLSRNYPTVEIRVSDVCLDPDDTVLVAALARGLVDTAARDWRAGRPPEPVSVGLLRLASWRAAKSGVTDGLVHPLEWTPAPAETVVRALVDHVRDALADSGDLALVEESVARLFARGGGADLQRAAMARTGELPAVVKEAVERTAS